MPDIDAERYVDGLKALGATVAMINNRHGHANTSSFMADVVEHEAGLEPLGGTLSPMVEATLFERSDGTGRLLHLINNSGSFGPSVVEPVTMHDVEVVLPAEHEPIEVIGLLGGTPLEWRMAGGRLAVRVPELGLFEAIGIRETGSDHVPRR
jgi:hypothetical protein